MTVRLHDTYLLYKINTEYYYINDNQHYYLGVYMRYVEGFKFTFNDNNILKESIGVSYYTGDPVQNGWGKILEEKDNKFKTIEQYYSINILNEVETIVTRDYKLNQFIND